MEHRGLDFQRIAYQEGRDPIPADHPEREYIERERNDVANLSEAGRKERDFIIKQLAKLEVLRPVTVENVEEYRSNVEAVRLESQMFYRRLSNGNRK